MKHTEMMPSALPTGDPAPPDGRLTRSQVAATTGTPFGVYVHVPFCAARCGYCDFNTYTAEELGNSVSRGSYADTVLAELRLAAEVLRYGNPTVSSIFFGGGTPSLLPAEHLDLIVREIGERFEVAPDVEVTTEANPESVTGPYLGKLREAGFTRISVGMQSAVPRMLEVLDRRHRPGRPEEVVAEAHAAGFEHVNLDLIYGTPGETEEDWQASLDAAIAAGSDHISAYALVVEEGTALARQIGSGVVEQPDDDVAADRYIQADEALAAAGFQWYEVSNWATSDAARCRHNELYWGDANWWGIGPGAHSHVSGVRWWNVKHPVRYTTMLEAGMSPAAGRETLDPAQRRLERVMLEVRRRAGLAFADISESARLKVPQLIKWGLVEQESFFDDRVVLTQRGRLMADAVVRELTE